MAIAPCLHRWLVALRRLISPAIAGKKSSAGFRIALAGAASPRCAIVINTNTQAPIASVTFF